MKFDIIVIGGGHAGIEAAYIASQFNLDIAIITLPEVGLASAPCNPAVGGVGKGQVVRELDALGGLMPILADKSGIQYRILNESKGYAVQSTRVQIDKELYSQNAESFITSIPNIKVIRDRVNNISQHSSVYSVSTEGNSSFYSKKLILTVGTFLGGKLHTGREVTLGGRVNSDPSVSMNEMFSKIKKIPTRFKTGTPPRLDKNKIDYSKLEEQESDPRTNNFHWRNQDNAREVRQVSCYLTRTNEKTMDIIRRNKDESPLFNGQIKGVGARYCPSIEDKAFRYPEKHNHHIFIEPEGLNNNTVYPSGISSSLPKDVQEDYVKSINGLEETSIITYGYAVEYDVVDTTDLKLTLEHTQFDGLYFAGQVNGTSGYEEAAGQGYIAGVNAALKLTKQPEFSVSRHDSYIGVMIEDLVSNKRDEPYRLFTARSENRLYLREDNAVLRMAEYRELLNLNDEIDSYQKSFISNYNLLSELLDNSYVNPNERPYRTILKDRILERRMSLSELLKQSWIDPIETLNAILVEFNVCMPRNLLETLAISKKYEGYIQRARQQLLKLKKLEKAQINWRDLADSSNISFECKQRIKDIKPTTFGQLKRIHGIRPATLAVVAGRNY
jgi:tRNA uridine 5-carboxymethylaminomethyl modification enzyme